MPRSTAATRPSSPSRVQRAARLLLLTGLLVCAAHPAWASGGGGAAMPWDDKLTAVADSITGPVAKAIGVIAIALTGLGVAFSEGGSWVRKGLSVIFGLSIAFTASSFALSFFTFTGGAAF
jgi:type IV secretory pathway VirB2 component (pilin)